jgi:hypothetical protein
MSRPQKIIPPVKGGFQQIVNAVADGKGLKSLAKEKSGSTNSVRASEPAKAKKG